MASRLLVIVASSALWFTYSLASDDGPQQGRTDKPKAPLDNKYENGAENPRALIDKLIDGLADGDAEKVSSCFDTSSEKGQLAAATAGTLAGLPRSQAAELRSSREGGDFPLHGGRPEPHRDL